MLLIFGSAACKSVVDRGGDKLGYHLIDAFTDILAVKHLAALIIYDVTLSVHDIVVLQDRLTGLEVAALNGFLCLLNGVGQHLVVKRSVLVNSEGLHHVHHSLRAEKTHDIIGHGDEEAALARVALTAGTATQLIIDTAGLVALGAADEQAACGSDLLGFLRAHHLVRIHALTEHCSCLEYLLIGRFGIACCLGDDLVGEAGFAQVVLCKILCVTAEHDIGTTACHVRCDGHGAELACLSDYLRFLLVVLGVQDIVLDAALFKKSGQIFALFYGDSADQNGLTLFVALDYLLDNGLILADIVFVHDIGVVDPRNGLVRGYLDDIQLIYSRKLLSLCDGRTGHTGELFVKSEVVLEGDGRKGLVLTLNIDMLLGLYRLMQTLAVAAAKHDTAGKLVNDEYLAVFDDIVDITLHYAVGTQRLIDMMREGGVFDIGVIFKIKGTLCLLDASCSEGRSSRLLVDDVVCVDVFVLFLLGIGGGVDLDLES